jgi:hypothetical protein
MYSEDFSLALIDNELGIEENKPAFRHSSFID